MTQFTVNLCVLTVWVFFQTFNYYFINNAECDDDVCGEEQEVGCTCGEEGVKVSFTKFVKTFLLVMVR